MQDLVPRATSELESVKDDVQAIIDGVRAGGDGALVRYTLQFDGVELPPEELMVGEEAFAEAYERVTPELVEAIRFALRNIRAFHSAQLREPWFVETSEGVKVGQILRPIDSVGVYIPGGRAVYPSTVLMTVAPAKVAGVGRVLLATPPKEDGLPAPSILVAAREAGVDEVLCAGGAQAIAAMAFGTETVKPVDKIVGPGNKYVNAAKRLLANEVAIDTPAGPSEVLIIADESSNPRLAAIDFLSQVEHDPDNVGILVVPSREYLERVKAEWEGFLPGLSRAKIIRASMERNCIAVVVNSTDEAVRVSNLVAPEHLEILTENPREVLAKVKHAGAIFLGHNSPVPIGDYAAGSNHVLPTGGAARVYSGLNTLDFVKVIDVVDSSARGLENLRRAVIALAKFEGLDAHAKAVEVRENASKKKRADRNTE
ncbi:MAG: histidinol dehydrogenase [Promethearchaeota archaeon]